MKIPKIDWFQLKKEFLLDKNLTLKEHARRNCLSYNQLRKLSGKQGWYADKKQVWQLIEKLLFKEVELKW